MLRNAREQHSLRVREAFSNKNCKQLWDSVKDILNFKNGEALHVSNEMETSVGSFVREPVRMNEPLGRTNRTGLFLSFVSFTIRFTGNSTERTNEFLVALTPLSLTDSAENRAMACIP